MDALDVGGVEHALGLLEELLGADRDRARRGLAVAEVRVQTGDVTGFRHRAASIQLRPSSRAQDDALAQAPAGDLQRRLAEARPRPPRAASSPAGSRRTRSTCEAQARAASAAGSASRTARTRAIVAGASSPPRRGRSDVALPPTASTSSRGGRVDAGEQRRRSRRARRRARRAPAGRRAGGARPATPEPIGSDADQLTPSRGVPATSSRRAAADVDDADRSRRAASASVARSRRRRPARASLGAVEHLGRARRRRAARPRTASSRLAARRIAAVPTTRTSRRARARARARTCAATIRRQPRRPSRSAIAPSAPADEAQEAPHGEDLAQPRAVALGDEQARRVRADVDARAAHLVAIISAVSTSAPAILVRDLRKSYGDHEAVRGIDFEVAGGEVFGLLGPNGAGKTTTVEILEGYRTRTSGIVSVLGHDPRAALARAARARRHRPAVDRACTATSRCARRSRHWARLLPAPARRRRGHRRSPACRRRRTPTRARCRGGQQRRLDLALALVGDPELIFLDEPTTGFDPAARRAAWEVVRSLQDLGKTILLTTHYLDEAQALCDRVAIVKDGRILAEGPPGELGAASTRYRVTWRDEDGDAPDARGRGPDRAAAPAHERGARARRRRCATSPSRGPSLEDVYLELTAEEPEEARHG